MSGDLHPPEREPVREPDSHARSHKSPAPQTPNARRADALVSISSEQLFAGAAEVQITHRGALYRLKQTALGKLILTK